MSKLSMALNHRRVYILFIIMFTFLFIFSIVACLATFYVLHGVIDEDKFFKYVLSYFSCNCSMSICFVIFIFITYCFYVRFDLINLCIQRHFATQEEELENFKKSSYEARSKLLLKLADLHDGLVDSTKNTNDCFAFQIMTVVAGMFSINIVRHVVMNIQYKIYSKILYFSTFAIYRVFVQNDVLSFSKASVQYAWNIYFLLYALGIIFLSSLMTRTGKFTAILVHKAINFLDEDDPIVDRVSFRTAIGTNYN